MFSKLLNTVRDVYAGVYCAAHLCTYDEYVCATTTPTMGVWEYTKKYPLRVKMIVAPIMGALIGVAYVYKLMPMMYALALGWYVWGFIGDYLTARRNYSTYSPLVKKFIESKLLLRVWGIRHIAFGLSMVCVFSYSFICTLIGTAIMHSVLA